MHISAFPKCYLDDICVRKTMTVFDWIEMSKSLGAEGLEMYSGFFESLDDAYIDRVGEAIQRAGYAMPMLCYSPNFTHPDPDERKREVEKQIEMIRITRRLGGRGAACRVLSGQAYPEVSIAQGVEWVVECIRALLPVAREYGVILTMENHFKDGYWQYREFAQKMNVFLQIVNAIDDTEYFGVQYDPSNALVAGDDPIELLEAVKHRVKTMHASDRYLEPGYRLEDMRQADGTLGYPKGLVHGVTGKGLNDYDKIFQILKSVNYQGWVSIEDGMNGMDEMRESIEFLKKMRAKYFQ
ncbi:MAG: sugar phosphate isomerase/epimerase [Anaerolineae bacterium]|nr:sugar phosphate isomerase/epimerase [Anaerolineae bacterium]